MYTRRRRVVVVSGAKMYVANQPVRLPADHQQHLRMGLEADESVDDVCAGFLQPIRERDVRGLVKARHEFDD